MRRNITDCLIISTLCLYSPFSSLAMDDETQSITKPTAVKQKEQHLVQENSIAHKGKSSPPSLEERDQDVSPLKKNNTLTESALMHSLGTSSHWSDIFDIYQQLKQMSMDEAGEISFKKLLKTLEKDPYGASWLLYAGKKCWEQNYVKDAKRAAELSIEKQEDVSELVVALKIIKDFGFNDLAAKGRTKLVKTFNHHPSLYRLKKYFDSLFKMGERICALQLCEIAFKKSLKSTYQFSDLFEIIMLLHEAKEDKMVTQGLQQAIKVCKPGDATILLNGQSFGLYDSPYCLLIISALSQKCENKSLSRQAADEAISYALAEPYDTLEGLLGVLKDLEANFQRLEFPTLVKKVEYYTSEIESPSIGQTLSVSPKLFDIYWLAPGEAKGAEIKKERPYIIVTKPTQYSKGAMVTVIPLSTKRKQNISSIPFYIENKSQEARLDQVRSVDISRLENYFGSLAAHYRVQLRLAHKNYQGN